MLTKLAILILLPANVDADTANQLVGRWQSEPIHAEFSKTMTVEFQVLKEKLTEYELLKYLREFEESVLIGDTIEPAKGYMVANKVKSLQDFGPGRGKRILVEYAHLKDQYPLTLTVGERTARFARVVANKTKEAKPAIAAYEYLRVTNRQLREGSFAGLKYENVYGDQQDRILGVLNYIGGQGWDAMFQGDSEIIICKRRVGEQTRWEYSVKKGYTGPKRVDMIDQYLKETSTDGWELSAVHEKGDLVIFKRPLPAKELQEQKPYSKPIHIIK